MKHCLLYDRYRTLIDAQPHAVDLDFEQAVMQVEKQPKSDKPGKLKS